MPITVTLYCCFLRVRSIRPGKHFPSNVLLERWRVSFFRLQINDKSFTHTTKLSFDFLTKHDIMMIEYQRIGGIRLKKQLCVLCCLSMLLCCGACSTAEVQDDRSARPIRLTYPSKQKAEPKLTIEEITDSAVSDAERLSSFVYIPKREQLPDFMQNNPSLYAGMLQNILKLYYSGILSGKINQKNFTPRYSSDILPTASATPEERSKMAISCTVGGALEFFGYDQSDFMKYIEMYNGCLPHFCYDRDGNIYPDGSVLPQNVLKMNGMSQPLFFIFRYVNQNQAEKDAMSYAAENISYLIREYYQGILDGSVHSDNTTLHYVSDLLPSKDASVRERQKCAELATVAGALDYAGFYTAYDPYITKLGYDKHSSVFTLPDLTNPDILSISSPDVKISDLR